jgi:DNA adenine methylase
MAAVAARQVHQSARGAFLFVYLWLKRGLKVKDGLEFDNREALYYEHRRRFNELPSNGRAGSAEAAAVFYYLNRTCYNGLCRLNSSGQFNVPFDRYKRINYKRDFSNYRYIFSDWEFSSEDFERASVEADNFLYADPPYDVEFRSYSKESFSWDDQIRLGEWFKTSRAGRPVESGHRSDSPAVQEARI